MSLCVFAGQQNSVVSVATPDPLNSHILQELRWIRMAFHDALSQESAFVHGFWDY